MEDLMDVHPSERQLRTTWHGLRRSPAALLVEHFYSLRDTFHAVKEAPRDVERMIQAESLGMSDIVPPLLML